MTALRSKGDQALEAQREQAQQAAREQAQLDPRAVLIAIEVKLQEGDIKAARELVKRWKAGQL